MDFTLGLMVLGAISVLIEIVGVYVDDNPPVGRLMLMHKYGAACDDQAK